MRMSLMTVCWVVMFSSLVLAQDIKYRVYETTVQNLDKSEVYSAFYFEAEGVDNKDPDFIVVPDDSGKVFDRVPVGPNFDVCVLGSFQNISYAIIKPENMKYVKEIVPDPKEPKSLFLSYTPISEFFTHGAYKSPVYVPYAVTARGKNDKQSVLYGTLMVLWKEGLGQGVVGGGLLSGNSGNDFNRHYSVVRPTTFRGKVGETIIVSPRSETNTVLEYVIEKIIPLVEKDKIPQYTSSVNSALEENVRGIVTGICGYEQ